MRIRPRERKQVSMFGFEPDTSSDESCAPPPVKAARTLAPKLVAKRVNTAASTPRSVSRSATPPSHGKGGKKAAPKASTKAAASKPVPKGKRGAKKDSEGSDSSDDDNDRRRSAAFNVEKSPPAALPLHSSSKEKRSSEPVGDATMQKPRPKGKNSQTNGQGVLSLQAGAEAEDDVQRLTHSRGKVKKPLPKKSSNSSEEKAIESSEHRSPAAVDEIPPSKAFQDCSSAEPLDTSTETPPLIPSVPPSIEWFTMHYFDKIGVPYIFTNGDSGVCFNDGSCMQISGDGRDKTKHLLYVNKHQHHFTIAASSESFVALPRRLEKKFFCVVWCRQHLKSEKHAKPGAHGTQVTTPPLWKMLVPSLLGGTTSCPPYVASVTAACDDSGGNSCSAPVLFLSNSASPYPNDTYYLSDEE